MDDLPGVFQMVTAGVWLFFIVTWLTDIVAPASAKLAAFWLLAVALVSLFRAGSRALCSRRAAYMQTRGDRRRGRHGSDDRAEDPKAP